MHVLVRMALVVLAVLSSGCNDDSSDTAFADATGQSVGWSDDPFKTGSWEGVRPHGAGCVGGGDDRLDGPEAQRRKTSPFSTTPLARVGHVHEPSAGDRGLRLRPPLLLFPDRAPVLGAEGERMQTVGVWRR